ncbi:MAG TPA: hypothetical protein VGW34_04960 [Allosphingosinicella sp.]|nr:hypothetical protein [Allosphingosinicella sp.]
MSECGHLPSERELPREVPGELAAPRPSALAARLAAWRAGRAHDEANCRALFGASPELLQRIESGEVEPCDALAERIGRIVDAPPPSDAGAPPAPVRVETAAGPALPPGRAGAPDGGDRPRVPPRAPAVAAVHPVAALLAKRDTLDWEIWLFLGGEQKRLSIATARALLAELGPLVAVHDAPDLYEAQA